MEGYYAQEGGPQAISFPRPTATEPAVPLPTVTASPPRLEQITDFGHTTLWVVFVLMLLSTISFIGLSWRVPIPKRLFYQITTYVTLISTFTYYAMATGDGWNFHHISVAHGHKHDIPDTHTLVLRQIYWARFADWLLTTPLILFNLGAVAGLSGSNILNITVAATAMTVTGLFSTYSHGSKTQWGWYAMSWLAFATVGWHLAINARATAKRRGGQFFFNPVATYAVLVWVGYLIIWAVSDVSRGISPNETIIAYAVLDVLAKPALGFWVALGHDKSNNAQITVDGVWSEGFGQREGLLRVGERDGDA